jgi:PAS domain S-box-containing protein
MSIPPGSQDSASRPSTADAEHLFSQLFDLSPFPAIVSRLDDSTVLAINGRTSEMFGIAPRDAIGRHVTDYYVDPAERTHLLERIRQSGRADNVRLRIKRPAGDPFWALVSVQLVTWKGDPALLTIFSDITEQLAAGPPSRRASNGWPPRATR